MKFRNIRGFIFDLDGTLIDSLHIWATIDERYLKRHGLTVPDDIAESIEGMSLPEAAAYFKERFEIADSAETIAEEWRVMARESYAHEIQPTRGARCILNELYDSGYTLALGSSNSRTLVDPLFQRLNWNRYFSHVLFSEEVVEGKPSPRLFLELAKRMEINPEAIVVVEDSPAGLIAARSAGMRAIAVKRDDFLTDWSYMMKLADIAVESLDDLIPTTSWVMQ